MFFASLKLFDLISIYGSAQKREGLGICDAPGFPHSAEELGSRHGVAGRRSALIPSELRSLTMPVPDV